MRLFMKSTRVSGRSRLKMAIQTGIHILVFIANLKRRMLQCLHLLRQKLQMAVLQAVHIIDNVYFTLTKPVLS